MSAECLLYMCLLNGKKYIKRKKLWKKLFVVENETFFKKYLYLKKKSKTLLIVHT